MRRFRTCSRGTRSRRGSRSRRSCGCSAFPPEATFSRSAAAGGVALAPLAERCRPRSLTGLDIDAALLAEARAAAPDARLIHGDVRRLPFAGKSFDLVVDFGTCYHVAHAERALAEIERVLRPGGLFVHETPVAQLFAHPLRTSRRSLPWEVAPSLRFSRTAIFWAVRRKAEA